ncbi:hypothetical protein N431DRAFT_460816 [Stipitochalara longipes BDJ]|nr:hypothetical protein N431DRAFT_460816 [Stipitochalara longipes BDJ]
MASQFIFFFILSVMTTRILAAPRTYPEVIPGPGLPSLASLNLTSADLYEMDYHTVLSPIVSREENSVSVPQWKLNCDGQKCQAADAVASSNSARILAHELEPNQFSSCQDVARGGGKIMDSCTKYGLVAGQGASWSNGKYIVDIALAGTGEK